MKLIDFIVCDDIRQEIGNKTTLIGVYDETLLFPVQKLSDDKWPKTIKLGFFMRIKIHETDEIPDEFSLEFIMNKKVFAKAAANITTSERPKYMVFALVNNNFQIPNPDPLMFTLKLFKNKTLLFEDALDYVLQVSVEEGASS